MGVLSWRIRKKPVSIDLIPILFAIAVLFWASGFDIIYALQDEEFDKSLNLNSVPVKIGKRNALHLSTFLHLLCAGTMVWASYEMSLLYPSYTWISTLATVVFIALLFYQHTLVKPNDLSRVNLAFFTTNGIASLIFGSLVILDLFL